MLSCSSSTRYLFVVYDLLEHVALGGLMILLAQPCSLGSFPSARRRGESSSTSTVWLRTAAPGKASVLLLQNTPRATSAAP